MTFKTTSESMNHIARVASASTRPRANGRIDLIPLDAREPEEYYNSVKAQYVVLSQQQQSLQARLTDLRKQLKQTLPWDEYSRIEAERKRLAEVFEELQPKCSELRKMARAAGKDAWFAVFHAIAKSVLDRDEFMKVENQVNELLDRNIVEIGKGEAECSQQSKETRNRSEARRVRRVRFRGKMERRDQIEKTTAER